MKNAPINTKTIGLISALSIVLFLTHCQKEQLSLTTWTQANVPTSAEITSVWMLNDQQGFASAGISWEVGYLLSTTDGGQNWQIDDTLRHKMECVMADSIGHVYAVGQSGICCERPPGQRWIKYREDYHWHRSCFMVNDKVGLIVSGESFGEGLVRVHGPEYFWALDTVFEFPNQMQSIWATDAQHWHACGLGWVIRSDNGGYTWERMPVSNDFFSDIHFPSPQTGYICGTSGSILKTTDGGQNWRFIRKGGSAKPRLRHFNAIWFETNDKGWVAGEDGLLWRTTDGGDHWAEVKDLPAHIDFSEIFVRNGRGWVCGTNGAVFVFEE